MANSAHEHPFYRPLWRRIAIVVVTGLWAALELYRGSDGLWVALSCGSFAYSLWAFILTYPKQTDTPPPPG